QRRPVGIPREYIELTGSCRLAAQYRIAAKVDGGICTQSVPVLHVWKVSEDTLPGFGCVDRRIDDGALFGALSVIEKEKERLVFDDRSAKPATKLIAVRIGRLHTVEVVEPRV